MLLNPPKFNEALVSVEQGTGDVFVQTRIYAWLEVQTREGDGRKLWRLKDSLFRDRQLGQRLLLQLVACSKVSETSVLDSVGSGTGERLESLWSVSVTN